MKKVFVTGGTGYIGYSLIQKLIEDGYHVHALVRSIPEYDLFDHPQVKVIQGELSDIDILTKAMEGCEYAFHLAAYAKPWAKDNTTYFKVNVTGTINVLEAALQNGIKKLIYSSSCAVIGRSNGQPASEEQIRDIDFFTEYESSKFISETYVKEYALKGLETVIVSPSKVYGPGLMTESNAVSQLIKLYMEGNWHIMPGDGSSVGCYCYIEDVVNGFLKAVQHGRSGEKYIVGGINISIQNLFEEIKKLSEKNYFLVKVPVPIMMLIGWKEEVGAELFGIEPLITRKWIRKYNYNLACSSEKAIKELGYSITPLTEGLGKTIAWLKKEYIIN